MWGLRALAQFHENEMFPGLFQDFMDGYIQFLKLPPLLVQHLVLIRGTPTQEDPNQ